jgi:hypothetical protein
VILSKPIRKQILAGKRTELRFPASKRCPLKAGHHYGMLKDADDDSGLRFEVIAITQKGRQWVCLVKLAQDVPRFMAKQDGQQNPEQYDFSHQAAIDDAECIPDLDQRRMSNEARERDRVTRIEQAGDLLAACGEIRSAITGLEPELKRSISRELWTLKGRMDALERKLKRQVAA